MRIRRTMGRLGRITRVCEHFKIQASRDTDTRVCEPLERTRMTNDVADEGVDK